MSTAFWWLAGAGVGFLLLAVAVLVKLNFSEQALVPLASAIVIGILTFTITFASSLKGSTEETAFATSLVEDMRAHLPAFINPDSTGSAISVRSSELSSIARGAFAPGTLPQPALPETEVTRFNLELLQYLIVRDLRDRQRVEWGLRQVRTRDGNFVATAAVNQPPVLTDPTSLQGEPALALFAGKRFGNSAFERMEWENVRLTLPQGSTIRLDSDPGSPQKGPASVGVVIRRPGFFALTISVTPMPITGAGVLPEGLTVDAADKPHLRTHYYVVKAKGEFYRLTAGNRLTEQNKAWVGWAIRELEAHFGDAATLGDAMPR